jgi:hypothetical protein
MASSIGDSTMLETLGTVAFVVFAAFVAFKSVTRRAGLTPEQRQLEDQAREIRKLKREQQRQRWD